MAATRWCGWGSARCRPSSTKPCACACLTIYRRQLAKHTQLFEGGDEMLTELERRGLAWGIVTNKPGWLTDPLLIEVNLHKRARAVVSGDTLAERKPHPLPLLHAAATMGVEPAHCVYVGDAERDMQAAQAAGMYALVAGFGYLGDDDRADDLVLAWLAAHAARSARTGSTSPSQRAAKNNGSRMNSAWLIASDRRARRGAHRLSGRHTARCAAHAELSDRAGGGARAQLAVKPTCASARPSCCAQSEAQVRAAVESASRLALDANSETFLKLGARSFRTATRPRRAPRSRSAKKPSKQLVEPLKARAAHAGGTVASAGARTAASPPARSPDRSKTSSNVQDLLQRETRNLSTALRRPEVRGRWGEITLRRVVELAGMSEHCDFTEQTQVERAATAAPLRPDLLVRMPDARSIVVDAKTPLDAYMDAVEAQDDETRSSALAPPCTAGGTARARARPEELLGAVRTQPGVRGVVPARRSVPVGGAGRAARSDRFRAQATHHRHDAFDAHGIAQGHRVWLAAEPGHRERARDPRAGPGSAQAAQRVREPPAEGGSLARQRGRVIQLVRGLDGTQCDATGAQVSRSSASPAMPLSRRSIRSNSRFECLRGDRRWKPTNRPIHPEQLPEHERLLRSAPAPAGAR